MRSLPVVALAATLLAGCGPSVTVFHKTSPRRVELAKRAAAPRTAALARRLDEHTVVLKLKRSRDVRLTRTVHYNAAQTDYYSTRNPFYGVVDWFVGWWLVVVPPFPRPEVGPDTPTRRARWNTLPALAGLNPAQSIIANRIEHRPTSDEQVFSDPPVERQYTVHVPAANLRVRYRVLDAARAPMTRGEAVTDVHGRVIVHGAGTDAVAIEVTTPDGVMMIAISEDAAPAAAVPDPLPTRPAN